MRIILFFIFMVSFQSGYAQILKYTYLDNPPWNSIAPFNPFTCSQTGAELVIHETDIDKLSSNGITVLGDEIYLIDVQNELLRYNRVTGLYDYIFTFPGPTNSVYNINDNNLDTIYVYSGLDQILFGFDINTVTASVIGILPSTFRFTYHNGKMYGFEPPDKIYIYDIQTESHTLQSIDSIVGLSPVGVAVNHINCESLSLLILFSEIISGPLDYRTSIYEYFPFTGELQLNCTSEGELIQRITEYYPDYNCELLIDADKDDSGGLAPYHFRQRPLCSPGDIGVTDTDPYVYSSLGQIDSVVVQLSTPVQDPGEEFVELIPDPAYTLRGSGTERIVIESTTFEGYKQALSRLRYRHLGQNSYTEGERTIWLTAHRLQQVSDTANCYIPVMQGKSAGEGMYLEVCQQNSSIDFRDSLSFDADLEGNWAYAPVAPLQLAGIFTTYYIVDSGHCGLDTATFEVMVYDSVDLQLLTDTVICDGLPFNLTPTGGLPDYEYIWSTGASTESIEVINSGVYSVIVSNGPCTLELESEVTILPPIISDLPDTIEVCDLTVSLNAPVESQYTYAWNTGAVSSSIAVNSSGVYSVRISNGECSIIDSSVVLIYSLPELNLGADTTLCEGSVLLNLPGLPDGSIIEWQDGSINSEYKVTESGLYSVELTNGLCNVSDSIIINIINPDLINLGPDVTLCDTLDLTLSISGIWDLVLWSTGATGQTTMITTSGQISVVASIAGCTVRDTIFIDRITCITCNVFIPGGVSPNADGINDRLEIFSNCDLDIESMEIYDRWGGLRYKTLETKTRWPDNSTPEGVYVYKLVYREPDQKTSIVLSGEVTVIR